MFSPSCVGVVGSACMLVELFGSGGVGMSWSVPALLVCFPLLDGAFVGVDITLCLRSEGSGPVLLLSASGATGTAILRLFIISSCILNICSTFASSA